MNETDHDTASNDATSSVASRMTAEELESFLYSHFEDFRGGRIRVEQAANKYARVRMSCDERHLRPGGTVSGPSLMMLADMAMYMALLGMIGPVALAVTTNLNINFLRKPPRADVIAECRLLKLGKRIAVGEVTMYSAEDPEPVAHATVSYSIPPPSHPAQASL
ncbi:MAG TPA: PaaI family thioesterase [Blastocatellia bacterium]|nr:PaaI family thioesterase [Blastocatellia bacterium]